MPRTLVSCGELVRLSPISNIYAASLSVLCISLSMPFTMAPSIIFYYQILNCIILLGFFFCKMLCKTSISYNYRKQCEEKYRFFVQKTTSAANSIFWYPFFCFLYQNYFEVHKMSISSVLWLFGVFFPPCFPCSHLMLSFKKREKVIYPMEEFCSRSNKVEVSGKAWLIWSAKENSRVLSM